MAKFSLKLYRESLGEAYDRDIAFSSSLEHFGGGPDPISMAFGGSNFTSSSLLELITLFIHC